MASRFPAFNYGRPDCEKIERSEQSSSELKRLAAQNNKENLDLSKAEGLMRESGLELHYRTQSPKFCNGIEKLI